MVDIGCINRVKRRARYYTAEDTRFPFDVLSLALHASNKIFIDAMKMRFFFLSTRPFESVRLFIFFSIEKTMENIFFDGYREEPIKANRHCVLFPPFFLRNSQF